MSNIRTIEEIQEDIRTLTRVPSMFIDAKLEELADEVGKKFSLEKQDKYKWHDLRKNPDDLPMHAQDVEVVLHDETHCFMFLDFCIEENEYWWYSSYPHEGDEQPLFYVRAWREIKPFEVEE